MANCAAMYERGLPPSSYRPKPGHSYRMTLRTDGRPNNGDYQAMADGKGHREAQGGQNSQSNFASVLRDDQLVLQRHSAGRSSTARSSNSSNSSSRDDLLLMGSSALDTDTKKRSTLYGVTSFIIVTEFCERLAYYGFAGALFVAL